MRPKFSVSCCRKTATKKRININFSGINKDQPEDSMQSSFRNDITPNKKTQSLSCFTDSFSSEAGPAALSSPRMESVSIAAGRIIDQIFPNKVPAIKTAIFVIGHSCAGKTFLSNAIDLKMPSGFKANKFSSCAFIYREIKNNPGDLTIEKLDKLICCFEKDLYASNEYKQLYSELRNQYKDGLLKNEDKKSISGQIKLAKRINEAKAICANNETAKFDMRGVMELDNAIKLAEFFKKNNYNIIIINPFVLDPEILARRLLQREINGKNGSASRLMVPGFYNKANFENVIHEWEQSLRPEVMKKIAGLGDFFAIRTDDPKNIYSLHGDNDMEILFKEKRKISTESLWRDIDKQCLAEIKKISMEKNKHIDSSFVASSQFVNKN